MPNLKLRNSGSYVVSDLKNPDVQAQWLGVGLILSELKLGATQG